MTAILGSGGMPARGACVQIRDARAGARTRADRSRAIFNLMMGFAVDSLYFARLAFARTIQGWWRQNRAFRRLRVFGCAGLGEMPEIWSDSAEQIASLTIGLAVGVEYA
jgi:hypothetical protein